MLASNGPANISGKRVMTSMRTAIVLVQELVEILALLLALLPELLCVGQVLARRLEVRLGRTDVGHLQRVVDHGGCLVAALNRLAVGIMDPPWAGWRVQTGEGP